MNFKDNYVNILGNGLEKLTKINNLTLEFHNTFITRKGVKDLSNVIEKLK